MIREFEGRSEEEAVENAIAELNLTREDFDVEILDSVKKGLFRKPIIRIRVHVDERSFFEDKSVPADDNEKQIIAFLEELIGKMGYEGTVSVGFREEKKIGLNIQSKNSGILIGKKGKNLDALQLLVNVFAGKLGSHIRVVVDTENYRVRREENIVLIAKKTAQSVKKSGKSRLLEPMNPFERRLVHTAINEMSGISTKSEGEGLYKQVRIFYTGE